MTLPTQLPRGIHEIQPLESCVDFGSMCARDPRKGGPTLILDLPQRMGVFADCLASCSGLGRSSYGAAEDQHCHADVVIMLQYLCVYLKLGLQLGVFRLGLVSSTSSPLLIDHFVTNLGPSQPPLSYRHRSVVRTMFVGGLIKFFQKDTN